MKKELRYFKALLLISLLFFLVYPAQLKGQADNPAITQGTIHSTTPGVRSTALGDATVADYRELSTVSINPASLSFVRNLKRLEFNTSQSWNTNLMLQNLTLPIFADATHRVALQTGILHKGIDATNPTGSGLASAPELMLYRFDLGYAYSFDSVLSIGVLNSLSLTRNAESNYTTNLISFGVLYAPSQSISYGLAFRNLGRNISYKVSEEETELSTYNMHESLELGATLNFPVDTDRTYLSLSLGNEKKFRESGIWYKIGLELNINSQLQLRSGLIMQPESDIYAPRFGVGMNFKKYSVGYSFSTGKKLNERFHQLGMIIHFNRI